MLLGGSSSLEPEEDSLEPEEEVETSLIPRYRSMGVRLRKEDLEEAPQGKDDGKGDPPQERRWPREDEDRRKRGRGPREDDDRRRHWCFALEVHNGGRANLVGDDND